MAGLCVLGVVSVSADAAEDGDDSRPSDDGLQVIQRVTCQQVVPSFLVECDRHDSQVGPVRRSLPAGKALVDDGGRLGLCVDTLTQHLANDGAPRIGVGAEDRQQLKCAAQYKSEQHGLLHGCCTIRVERESPESL